ncbi:hypothetical protein [uncultured Parabacteroides sp.]|uniref:hypothetical protein n=1 Tax=uncultured Parabacteroides sp. TaxID=512312 RepID=UPI00265AA30B|nr:hypothetical protein [uncultured Parabacteroides sp.]
MKAIFEHSVFDEHSLLHLNWFMMVVEKSEYPVDLIRNLFEENILPNGLDGTDCEINITPERVEFREKIGDQVRMIAYTTLHKIED